MANNLTIFISPGPSYCRTESEAKIKTTDLKILKEFPKNIFSTETKPCTTEQQLFCSSLKKKVISLPYPEFKHTHTILISILYHEQVYLYAGKSKKHIIYFSVIDSAHLWLLVSFPIHCSISQHFLLPKDGQDISWETLRLETCKGRSQLFKRVVRRQCFSFQNEKTIAGIHLVFSQE